MPEHWTIQPYKLEFRAKIHRMITMHAHPRQTDRRTDGRTSCQLRDDSF